MRANGRLLPAPAGSILIDVDQAYSNCPKYIQRRAAGPESAAARQEPGNRSFALSEPQRMAIRGADTFFIATVNPDEGADASHRGGMPGFIEVEGDRLTWPDYAGNLMFNTLGNIAAHPRAGLLIPDFTTGDLLQVTGRAAIDWESTRIAVTPGAERLVSLQVEEVVQFSGALAAVPMAPDYSPFNPALGEPG